MVESIAHQKKRTSTDAISHRHMSEFPNKIREQSLVCRPANMGPFQINEAFFCVQASAKTGQGAVAADAPMARHDDG